MQLGLQRPEHQTQNTISNHLDQRLSNFWELCPQRDESTTRSAQTPNKHSTSSQSFLEEHYKTLRNSVGNADVHAGNNDTSALLHQQSRHGWEVWISENPFSKPHPKARNLSPPIAHNLPCFHIAWKRCLFKLTPTFNTTRRWPILFSDVTALIWTFTWCHSTSAWGKTSPSPNSVLNRSFWGTEGSRLGLKCALFILSSFHIFNLHWGSLTKKVRVLHNSPGGFQAYREGHLFLALNMLYYYYSKTFFNFCFIYLENRVCQNDSLSRFQWTDLSGETVVLLL